MNRLCSQNIWRMLTSCAFLLLMTFQRTTSKIVTTLNGQVDGFTEDAIDGVTVDAYLGIPFAKPPLGDLRFKPPEPVQNWKDVLQAKTQPNSCMQSKDTMFGRFKGVEMWNTNTTISEDCLYLNMWVPRTTDGSKLTTMLWIYGGSYVYGSITLDVYNGKYLAAKKSVIVASMQYRMGVHGFLYTGTLEAAGNMGLLDQQMAMKWMYDNVESFGGDKTKITLFGESAGAGSVSHHLFAPTSWPYFNNAIMQSGTSFAPWAVQNSTDLIALAADLARVTHCEQGTMVDIVKCLRKLNATDLENKQWELKNGHIGTFRPTVDGRFLPNHPTYLMNAGKVKDTDILLGTTKDEGEFFLVYFYQDIIKPERLWNPKVLTRSEFLEIVKRIAGVKDGVELDSIVYTYEKSILPKLRGSYMDILDNILGDYMFKCSIHDLASGYSQSNATDGRAYVYSFNYRSSWNPWPGWMGSLHGYEIEFVFGHPFNSKLNYTSKERAISDTVMEYFASFAKTGKPGSPSLTDWPFFNSTTEEHMVFTESGTVDVSSSYRTKECSYWKYLAPKIKAFSDTITSGSNARFPIAALVCLLAIIVTLTYF